MNSLKIFTAVSATAVLLYASGCSSDSSDEVATPVTSDAVATPASSDVVAQPESSDEAVTPGSVCAQIEDAGIGKNCAPGTAGGLAVAATETYDFDLPSVPGESGTVMIFDNADLYQKTVKSYDDAAFLAGPHRYGSENALIFVQINEGLSSSDGQKVKDIVDSL